MKNILLIFLVFTFLGCGMNAKTPKAYNDGLSEGKRVENINESLEFDDVPAAMIMVWFPDSGYYNQFHAKFVNSTVKSAEELRNQCISSVPKNSELMLRALESFYNSSTKIKKEIVQKSVSKKIIDGKYKLAKNEVADLKCESEDEELVIPNECDEVLLKKDKLKSERSILKKEIGALGNELRAQGGIYRTQLVTSLKEFQVLCDPVVDWENASSEEKDMDKVNLIYPTNDGSPDELGYVMNLNSKTDFEIEFPVHGPNQISYSSSEGDFKIIDLITTSNGRRVFTLHMFEKNINNEKTGAVIEFELVENKIFGMLRYEGEISKIVKNEVVKKGAAKFEFSAL